MLSRMRPKEQFGLDLQLTEHCKTEPPMRSTSLLEIGGTFSKMYCVLCDNKENYITKNLRNRM